MQAQNVGKNARADVEMAESPETESEGASAPWNGLRCRPDAARGHVESYFVKLNDPTGRRALWLKATAFVREGGTPRVAEAWAIAFDRERGHVAVKETVGIGRARFGASGLDVSVAGLRLSPGRASGEVTSADRRVAFDLRFTMGVPPILHLPYARLYDAPLPKFKLVSPHPDARFTGEYTVDGERVTVDGWRGMQGHNWGAQHTELYAWAHCNQWDGEDDLVVEGATGRFRLGHWSHPASGGPLLAPPITGVFVRHRGVRYDFNEPLTLARAHGDIAARKWSFRAKNALGTVSGEFWAETPDFVGLAYANPDGATTYCLNSKLARGHVRLSLRGRPEIVAMTKCAALEIGTKDASHGVRMMA